MAAFLPLFSEYFQKGKEKAWELTNNVLNCFLILLIFICAILFIFTPQILNFIVPGFTIEEKAITSALTRIMFLSPIFFGISAIFSGILHYFNRFLVYSLAPILYNLGIILGILFLVPIFGIFGLAYGVILGALCHLAIQIPSAISAGFHYKPVFNFRFPGIKRIFKLMIPRTIGTAASHLNLIVITALASTLIPGSIAIFNFSNNLQYFPVGIIGISFAIAAFPALSKTWVNGQKEKFSENFSSVFKQILFLIIPISLLIFLLRAQIVRLILGTGQFGWLETRLTAASLGIFSLGLFASSLVPLLARAFFSLQDTKTPVIIGIISIVLNVALCFLFTRFLLNFSNIFQEFLRNFLKLREIKNIQVLSFPLALSISGIFNFSLLFCFLNKKISYLRLREFLLSFWKIFISCFPMTFFTYFTLRIVANLVNMNTFFGVFFQTIAALLIGLFVYLLAAFFLKSPEFETFKSSILRRFQK
ncbi:murein biosynthesis integral membrane protein MurJ [Patescibacteria group bacterium]|nr:murein biosynthesis integral membrane protein MurJ [Patescibacteria group bacterium]